MWTCWINLVEHWLFNTYKIYVMTPQLQISTAGVYLFPAKTSGAKNRIEENI